MKHTLIYIMLGLLLVVSFIAVLYAGNERIPIRDVAGIILTGESASESWLTIVLEFRLPKAITAVLVGIALSVSGLQMQTVFRNPLAGPYVLGISAGASLGVAIVMLGMGTTIGLAATTLSNWTIVLAAFAGSMSVLFLIFAVSARIRDVMTILILGMMFGSITSSLISVLQYFSNEQMLKTFTVWSMGSLNGVTAAQLRVVLPCVAGGLLLSLISLKRQNALLLGENIARSLGVNITATRLYIFCSTGILAGSVTAFCGPIGFVGIAVPHICRMLFANTDQRTLFVASMLVGATAMLASELVTLLPGGGVVLPVNSVTALIGIPVIIWMVMRNHKMGSLM